MAEQTHTVHCAWDAEAEVWVASSDDVPGLATGDDTLDSLVQKLKVVIPELLEANGLLSADDGRQLHACRQEAVREAGCRFERQGRGDHEIWYSPIAKRRFMSIRESNPATGPTTP